MATRSCIGIMLKTGEVKGIYCHWDGYIKGGVGETLVNHYNDPKKIRELIKLGNVSSLGEEIGTKHVFDSRPDNETTFYGRDRGERNQGPQLFKDAEEFVEYYQDSDYYYLFAADEWYYRNYAERAWTEVSRALAAEESCS